MAEEATLKQFSMLIPLKTLSDSENPWLSRLQIHLLLKWFFRVPASSVTCGDDLLIRRSLHMQPYLLSEMTNPTPRSFASSCYTNPSLGVRLPPMHPHLPVCFAFDSPACSRKNQMNVMPN